MTITKSRSVLLGLALAGLAMAGIVPSATAASVRPSTELQAAAATPSSLVVGQACPDVMVIGARGTNEGPKGDNPKVSDYVKDPNHGVGQTVESMYGSLVAANPELVFSLEPAVYPTVFGQSFSKFLSNAVQYLTDAQTGGTNIVQEIQNTDTTCGTNHVHYILAGYSIGAWAVHDALTILANHYPAQLNEIAGVTLFGDPLFSPLILVAQDYQDNDSTSGVAVLADPEDVAIPPYLLGNTGSWCFPTDPVCQGPDNNPLWPGEATACVADALGKQPPRPCSHFDYPPANTTDNAPAETTKAAEFLQPFLPPPMAPDTPGNVTAVATSQYTIQVAWTEATADVKEFNLDNGCPVGSCGPGATLAQTIAQTTGPVDTATFSVTPGSYQCFRVQAINNAGTSPWSSYGCISTPGLVLSATQKWTNTKVTIPAGYDVGISADGQITVSPTETVGPAGDPSCIPAQNYPGRAFPAPDLPCYSLIARIGNGTPFEVGTSTLITNAAAGVLFLGINDNSVSGNSGNWNVKIKFGGLP